jgi:hypothetical protein
MRKQLCSGVTLRLQVRYRAGLDCLLSAASADDPAAGGGWLQSATVGGRAPWLQRAPTAESGVG